MLDRQGSKKLLILGGTADALALAERLTAETDWNIVFSLAGVTSAPRLPERVTVRRGGFGGAAGLQAYLVTAEIDLLVDATHPYAAEISANARAAGKAAGCPLLRLERAAWTPRCNEIWTTVPDLAKAADVLPAYARVLLTTGRKEIGPFLARHDCHFVIRMIEMPEGSLSAAGHVTVLQARPPFTVDEEIALMQTHLIDTLVTKNAGGSGDAKLLASRALGVDIVMIDRPSGPAADAATIDQALVLIASHRV